MARSAVGIPLSSLLLLATFTGCGEAPSESTAKPLAGSFANKKAEGSRLPVRALDPDSLRNMSNLIAGNFSADEAEALDPVWQEHARFMDQAWEKIDRRLESMRQWAEQENIAAEHPQAPLLYPLGGPDLISAMQFFPQASSYLLIGLEAPGHLPSPEEFSAEALANDLERLRKPFSSFMDHGYFVRNEIDKDLSGGQFDGILPIILIGLVRAGQVPVNLEYVVIDPETYAIVPAPLDSPSARAVMIHFLPEDQAGSENPPPARAVYYFSQDLSNDALFTDEPFSRLIQRQDAINAYLKSAEYLLHTDDFSTFRKLILAKSQTLLQDDSGIPIRYLTSDTWDLQLYGEYTSVLAAYAHWLQKDLVAAFSKEDQVKPLSFDLGYNSNTDGGNLVLAVRKPEDKGTGSS